MTETLINGRHILQWHITHRCNLRCSHCYQGDYACEMPPDRLLDALSRYERWLRARGLRGQINLTGGEPLLHPDFFFLASEIRRRGMDFSVLTNGTLVDDGTAHRLSLLRPLFVQVSLDGTEAVHDRIRGRGSYIRALEGIDLLKARGVPVHVSFTAQTRNLSSLLPLSLICRLHRVDKLWFDRVVIPAAEDRDGLSLSTEQFRRLVRTAHALEKFTPLRCERALQFREGPDAACYHCGAGGNLLVLLADGSLMPCRRLPFVIGNLYEGELADILESSALMRQLRDAPVPEGCRACPHAMRCRGGARCVSCAKTGELFTRDVNCFLHTSE